MEFPFIAVVSLLIFAPFLVGESLLIWHKGTSAITKAALNGAVGLAAIYALGITVPLTATATILASLALLGQVSLSYRVYNTGVSVPLCCYYSVISIGLTILSGVLIGVHLREWDARTIWFFHGKILYFSDNQFTWNIPGLVREPDFHLDYPKLIAVLSALTARLLGEWNEASIKLALLPLMSVACAGILAAVHNPISLIFILTTTISWSGNYYLNGYMDPHLAAFSITSAMCFASLLRAPSFDHAWLGLTHLSLACSLKNEGFLVAIALLPPVVVLMITRRIPASFKKWPVLLVFSGPALWAIISRGAGLRNDVVSTSSIMNGSFTLDVMKIQTIILSLYDLGRLRPFIMLFLAALMIRFAIYRRVHLAPLYPIIAFIIYVSGAVVVYYSTPYDLGWHLSSSAFRVMLCAHGFLAAATALLFFPSTDRNA